MTVNLVRDVWAILYNGVNRSVPGNKVRVWLMEQLFPSRTALDPDKDIVAVQGADAGFGRDLIEVLADAGYETVAFVILMPEEADMVPGVTYYAVSQWDEAGVQAGVAAATEEIGTITAFIDATIFSWFARAATDPVTTYDTNGLLNTFAYHWFFAGALMPNMIRSGRGYFVSVVSTAAWMSPSYLGDIGAAEAATVSFHEALTADLGGYLHPRSGVHTLLVTTRDRDTSAWQDTTPVEAALQSSKRSAQSLLQALEWGTVGRIAAPFYLAPLPKVRALPWPVQMVVRSLLKVDNTEWAPPETTGVSAGTSKAVRTNKPSSTVEPEPSHGQIEAPSRVRRPRGPKRPAVPGVPRKGKRIPRGSSTRTASDPHHLTAVPEAPEPIDTAPPPQPTPVPAPPALRSLARPPRDAISV